MPDHRPNPPLLRLLQILLGTAAACWLLLAALLLAAALCHPTRAAEPGKVGVCTAVSAWRPTGVPVIRLQPGSLKDLASVAWGEARGDDAGYCAMLGVAAVIVNRVRLDPGYFGATIGQVIRKPAQFSVLLKSDPNRAKVLSVSETDPQFVVALLAAIAAVSGADPTDGAVYFFSSSMTPRPPWSKRLVRTAAIGSHLFFRDPRYAAR